MAFSIWAFFFCFSEIGIFFLAFFWAFFCSSVFLRHFLDRLFFKIYVFKKKAFFWAFFVGVFFDEFRKLAFFGRFYFGFFFYFWGVFFGVFWVFFSKIKKNVSLTTIRLGQKKLHFSKPVQHFFGRAPFFFLKCYV